jgi:hypothetical protein
LVGLRRGNLLLLLVGELSWARLLWGRLLRLLLLLLLLLLRLQVSLQLRLRCLPGLPVLLDLLLLGSSSRGSSQGSL